MNRITVFLFGFALVFSGVAGAQQMQITIDVPPVEGVIGPRLPVLITNNTPFYADVIARGKTVATCVAPGAVLGDAVRSGFNRVELPIIARLYDDLSCQRPVAISGTVIFIENRPVNWMMGSNLRYLNGQGGGNRENRPMPQMGGYLGVNLPVFVQLSGTSFQLVNATLFDITVYVSTGRGEIKAPFTLPGGFGSLYHAILVPEGDNGIVRVDVQFSDQGRYIGSWSTEFGVHRNHDGPRAVQLIIEPGSIQRPQQ